MDWRSDLFLIVELIELYSIRRMYLELDSRKTWKSVFELHGFHNWITPWISVLVDFSMLILVSRIGN